MSQPTAMVMSRQSRPSDKRTNSKLFFLTSQPKYIILCCGCSKELSQWDSSFEHPKHTLKLMSQKNYNNIFFLPFYTIFSLSSDTQKAGEGHPRIPSLHVQTKVKTFLIVDCISSSPLSCTFHAFSITMLGCVTVQLIQQPNTLH